MEIQGDAVLQVALVIYNGATDGDKYSDMSCVDTSVDVTLGCIRLVFLNKFVQSLLVCMPYFIVKFVSSLSDILEKFFYLCILLVTSLKIGQLFVLVLTPMRTFKSGIRPLYPQRVVKGD